MLDDLDEIFARNYDDGGRQRARRLLRVVAARLNRSGQDSFAPSILSMGSRVESVLGGVSLGALLGLLLPVAGWLVVLGADRVAPLLPELPTLDLSGVLTPLSFAVSWILLRWHDVFALVAPGNTAWILAIVFLVVTVRALLIPLVVVRVRALRRMQALQPRIEELRRTYADDQARLHDEIFRLFQAEKANPLLGCLPVLVLGPAFLSIFHVIGRLDPDATVAQTTLYGWSTAEFREAAGVTLFGVPIAGDHGTGSVVVVLVALWATLAYLNGYARLDLAVGPAQVSAQRSGLFLAPLLVLLVAFVVPVGVMLYSVTQFLLALVINVVVQRRYPAQARVAGPGVAFGLPFVITLGAVAMAVTPVLGDWWAMGLCLLGAGALLVLREWVPTWTGGLGPLGARRFLADAVHFGIVTHDDGLYRFRNPAVATALASGDGQHR